MAKDTTSEGTPGRRPDGPLTGVFATRSPDRPNPIGLHPVTVLEIAGLRLKVGPIEAIDGTPVIGLVVVNLASPGAGVNAGVSTLDTKAAEAPRHIERQGAPARLP